MAKKWTNTNLAGVLHYVTGNVDNRRAIFKDETNCIAFLEELQSIRRKHESRLIGFVVMPDHFHLIVNPRDGDIQSWIGELKSFSAKRLLRLIQRALLQLTRKRIRYGRKASRPCAFGVAG